MQRRSVHVGGHRRSAGAHAHNPREAILPVDIVLSRLIGPASGERRFLRSLCVAVAGVCWIDAGRVSGAPAPVSGWPDPRSALRRLELAPASIDAAWQRSVAENGDAAALPDWLIDALVPRRIWPLVGSVAVMGPAAAQQRLERFCRFETLRPARSYAGTVTTVSAGTVDTILTAGRRLFLAFNWLALRGEGGELMARWSLLPPAGSAHSLGAIPARLDRSGPPLRLVQGVLGSLEQRSAIGTALQRRRMVRDRLLLGLLVCSGARIGALSRARVADIDRYHRFPDATVGAALRLYPGKTAAGGQARWKALPAELHAWVAAYVGAAGLDCDQPLFPRADDPSSRVPRAPGSLTRILSGEKDRPGLLPRHGGYGGYSAHSVRHLAARLAHEVGRAHLSREAHPVAPTPEAFVASLLDHAQPRDPLGYLDTATEANRELTARAAALGIWEIVRDTSNRDLASELARLRRRRHEVLAASHTSSDQILEALLQAAALTAAVDDLREHG